MKIGKFVKWDSPVGNAWGRIEKIDSGTISVRVWRSHKESDAIVHLPIDYVEEDDSYEAEIASLYPRMPSDEELELIRQYTPDIRPEELVVYTITAANNLVNRSGWKFDKRGLEELAMLAIGVRSRGLPLPVETDHDWEQVSKTAGFVFDATVVVESAVDDILWQAGNNAINKEVATKEGLINLDFKAAFPRYSETADAIRLGCRGFVSLGRFIATDLVCPLDGKSFYDPSCPYLPPDPHWGYNPGMKFEADDGTVYEVAPYSIYAGLIDLGELSFVTIPKLLGVGVKRL
jgi:hypothetical protein